MNKKLYVGNLPYQIDEAQLQSIFEKAGTVETVSVVRDRATGQARGFAFVEMSSDAEAQEAIRQFNSADLGGRAMTVNEAKPQAERGGFGPRSKRSSESRW
jgi:RNA recognition motif-containing protein